MNEVQNLITVWRTKAQRLKVHACHAVTSRDTTGLLNEAWAIEDCADELTKALEFEKCKSCSTSQ